MRVMIGVSALLLSLGVIAGTVIVVEMTHESPAWSYVLVTAGSAGAASGILTLLRGWWLFMPRFLCPAAAVFAVVFGLSGIVWRNSNEDDRIILSSGIAALAIWAMWHREAKRAKLDAIGKPKP